MNFLEIKVNKDEFYDWIDKHLDKYQYIGGVSYKFVTLNSQIMDLHKFNDNIEKTVDLNVYYSNSIQKFFDRFPFQYSVIEKFTNLKKVSEIFHMNNTSVDKKTICILTFCLRLTFEEAIEMLKYYHFTVEENNQDKLICTYVYFFNKYFEKYNESFSKDKINDENTYVDFMNCIMKGFNNHLDEIDKYIVMQIKQRNSTK